MSEDRYVDAPPAGADGWGAVWRDDRQFPPRRSRYEWLLRFVRRLVRRVGEPDSDRQKNFNIALLDLIEDVRREVVAARRDLRADVESVQREGAAAIAAESAKMRELILIAAKRNDALIAALDQKIETVAARARDASNPEASNPEASNPDASNPMVAPSSPDVLYRRLEDSLRGGEAHVRADVAPYVRLAADHQPLLDVGCGRGELLEGCREANVAARGVDTNERSIADLRQRGFDVALAAVPECFASIAGGSLGSVAAIHVVEHLPIEALLALFSESARVLKPGGLLMIETPNAESIAVSASDFWRDPTHLAPRHPAALTVLAREHGFEIEEIRPVHDLPEGTPIPTLPTDPLELKRVIQAINDRFFAPQDLRLILRAR